MFVFGSVVSGVIPVILGVVAIGIAMGLAALLGLFMDLSFFVTNMITMIGLAVGIDYSCSSSPATGRSGSVVSRSTTPSRVPAPRPRKAVFFSGLTVVLALVGSLILPNTIFRAPRPRGHPGGPRRRRCASMTLLPAVLSLLGDRIEALRVRRRRTMD